MRSVIQKMIRCAAMNTEKAFMFWKLELVRTKERAAFMKKNAKVSHFVILIQRKYDHNVKIGLKVLADGVALTKAQ